MDALLLAAAVLLFFIGVVHSVLGEKLIFIRLRSRIKDQTSLDLSERHVRILWVSWHLVTLFGLVLVTVLEASGMDGFAFGGDINRDVLVIMQ